MSASLPSGTQPSVLLVTARTLPNAGGIETHVDEVSRRLAAASVPVTVLSADAARGLATVECRDGVTFRRFRGWPPGSDLKFSPGLGSAVRASGADVVHLQGVHTMVAPVTLLAARRAGIPAVVTFHTGGHSSFLRRELRPLQWRVLRPLLRQAAALVAVCEFEVDLFSRILGLPRSRVRLIRNGADPLPVAPVLPWERRGDPLIVSVGRLERYKGHHRLVRAMPALLAAAPGARLVLAGQGQYEPALRRMARSLGVDESVDIVAFGPDRRADLGALVASADVVALLSDYEAHPVAMMEALALGRPVVVAATSGLIELAREGLVRAIPARSAPATVAQELLAAAAVPLREHRPLPSWDACTADLLALYREVARCGS